MVSTEIQASIKIRNLRSIKELETVRDLEALVWSFDDSVPVNQTATVVKNGGFILGAFLQEKLIGFQYSFPGFDGKDVYLCSHSLGIHPDYRKVGIGEKLKWAQKELAAEMGYQFITWTYDPLETVNGNLNLHKLGGVCSTYIEDAYGEMDDGINSGTPTDRFLVEWQVQGKQPLRELDCDLPKALHTSLNNGYLVPKEANLDITADRLCVPVAGNFQEIKTIDFQLALSWREMTRKVFSYYFSKGWQATDLVKDTQMTNQYLYVLEKRR